MDGPIRSLPWPVWPSGDLDEAVIEGEIMSQTVLPSLGVVTVEREFVHDELVDVGKREHLFFATLYSQVSQPNV